MKKINILLCIIIACIFTTSKSQNTLFDSLYYHNVAYHFNDSLKITRDNIFSTYKSQFGLSTNDSMGIEQTQVEEYGFHSKYNQYYKGYRVEEAMMNIIGNHGVINYANGYLVKNLNISVSNSIDVNVALDSARAYIGIEKIPIWEDSIYIQTARDSMEDENYNSVLSSELIIAKKSGEFSNLNDAYVFAWHLIFKTTNPLELHSIYVNAINGNVIKTTNLQSEFVYSITGTGWTQYNGQYSNLRTAKDYAFSTNWKLYSNQKIETYNFINGISNVIKDNNNNWVESETKTAASAHWSAHRAYDYYLYNHGRWASDYNGRKLIIRANNNFNNPNIESAYTFEDNEDNIGIRPDNTNINPPDANNAGIGYSIATLDIIGHEYTHALINYNNNLNRYGDAGAITEGVCDVFGIMIERYVNGSCDWSIGEDADLTRYFNNPQDDNMHGQSFPSPSIYMGSHWLTSLYNNGAIPAADQSDETKHINGGILRKWFYLLSNGGTFNNTNVTALGIDKAQKILYISFNWWFWSNLKYPEAAKQTAEAAIYHYGKCSQEHKSVVQAWAAVGINVPLGLCPEAVILGNPVLNISDLEVNDAPQFKAQNTTSTTSLDPNKITWIVPTTWETEKIDDKLWIRGAQNYDSKPLILKYEVSSSEYIYDTVYVHFSDEVVIGDNQLPAEERNIGEYDNTSKIEEFLIYPNPAYNELHILTPPHAAFGEVIIYDLQGKMVNKSLLSNQYLKLNIANLHDGIYMVKYTSDSFTKTQKIIIKH